jgi:hypothetical protein
MMVTDDTSLRFRYGPVTRMMGGVFLAIGAAVLAAVVVVPGWSLMVAVPFTAGFATLGIVALRVGVAATPDGLVVNSGWRRRQFRWESVDGFRVEHSHGYQRVHVMLGRDRLVVLPVEDAAWPVTRPSELEKIKNALEQYRAKRHL